MVITGDLVEGYADLDDVSEYAEVLKRLRAKYGTIAVTGNHDIYRGGEFFFELARESGITVLENRGVTVAGEIQIAGINDPDGRRFKRKGPDMLKALKGLDPSMPVILLSHRPQYFKAAKGYGVDLQLSGH